MDQSLILLEGAKLAIQSYFNFMRLANRTPEEMQALYDEEKTRFLRNVPEDLPQV